MEAIEDEIIETERLRLRAPRPGDAERITEFIGDWDVAKMLARVPYPYALEDAHTWLNAQPARLAKGEAFTRAVELKSAQGVIGMIGLHDVLQIEGAKIGELGYWLAKPYWGKGLMTEAGRGFVRHIFEELEFAGLKSGHFKENFRSGQVLAKLGFRYAGENLHYCLARKTDVPHVDVVMTRAQWLDCMGRRAA